MQQDDSVKMKELDNYNESLDSVHEIALNTILNGGLFWIGSDAFSMDDFTGNFEIDSELFRSWLKEDCGKLKEATEEKLSEWCRRLAVQYIAYE